VLHLGLTLFNEYGGGVETIEEELIGRIRALSNEAKLILRKEGNKVFSKKLRDANSLIIKSAQNNLINSLDSKEVVNVNLAKFAVGLLENQNKNFLKLFQNDTRAISFLDTSFILEKERADKIEKVRLLRDAGLSYRDIESILGIPRSTVHLYASDEDDYDPEKDLN
jgi:hypothetical protein